MKGRRVWCIALAALCALPAGASANEIAVSPDGRSVYVGNSNIMGTGLWSLARDPATGDLTARGTIYAHATHLELSPDGRSLYTAMNVRFPGLADLSTFARDGAGNLTALPRVSAGASRAWRDIEVSPDGRHLYASDSERDELLTFSRDGSGRLVQRSVLAGTAGALAFSPDGLTVFVGREELHVLSRDQATGALTPQTVAPCDGCWTQSLALNQAGDRIYTEQRVFARSGVTWSLAHEAAYGAGSDVPAGLALASDETLYLVAGDPSRGGYLIQARLDGGELKALRTYRDLKDGVTGLTGVTAVALSPDERFLYARGERGVVMFSRLAGGNLAFKGLVPYPDASGTVAPRRISINGGKRYTNDPTVQVTLVSTGLPPGISLTGFFGPLSVSNDGGFLKPKRRRLDDDNSFTWRLASTGPDQLPKTVYVRGQWGPETLRDSIVLDETNPRVLAAKRSSRGKRRLRVKARDRISGVRSVQITGNRRKPGKWRRYSKRRGYRVGSRRLYVRVRDRAGNRSRWRRVKAAR